MTFLLSFCGMNFRIVTLGPPAYGVRPGCWGGAAEMFSNLNLIREFGLRESFPHVGLFKLGIGSKKADTSRPGDMGWP
jgi:hypothetical protein